MSLRRRLALSLALIATPLGAQNTASDTGPAAKVAEQFAAPARNGKDPVVDIAELTRRTSGVVVTP